ncbi:MAG: ATP-binding cassette domain-containing protein, partial [Planifilum sp.]
MDIVAKNVSYTYSEGTPFEKRALNNVNFRIPSASFTGIIGHTGSGKSTLIQHFNGLLRPMSGMLKVGDVTVSASLKNVSELRR